MARNSRCASSEVIRLANVALQNKGWTKQRLEMEAGCKSNTISNFFNGSRIDYRFFVGICDALGLEVKDVEDLSEYSETDDYHPFQTIIDEKTKDFVGREYVFDAITSFINTNPKGYFTIKGDPGMGKSAILAKYVQDTGCIVHFNVENEGPNRADQFLENVCEQLIKKYQVSYSLPLSAEAKQDGVFLKKLLDEVARKRNNQPVVIAVDALDEVDLLEQKKNANILYLPRYLPKGIYFVTTIRRGVEVPLMTEPQQQIFNLRDYQDQSFKDVCNYIQNRVNGSEQIRQWIKVQEVTQEKFIDEIATRSENNFMYLFYVLLGIEENIYPDLNLDNLPKGLQEYYKFHWRKMVINNINIKAIYHLAESLQPISCQLISKYIGETPLTVQSALNNWLQFLHKRPIEGEVCYSIYHSDFRRFLHNDERVKQAGVSLKEINKQKSDYLWKGLFGDE